MSDAPPHPRIACLFVPDFRLQVALRELGGEPEGGLALVDPEDGRRLILAASPGARTDGVRRGMTSIAAAALVPELMIREVDRAALAEAHDELEQAVRSVTPVFETTGSGVLYASFAGMSTRYIEEGEGGFLDDLREAAMALGFPARVGIAGTRFCARAAAVMEGRIPGYGPSAICVEPGQEAAFLAPLPLELLPDALDVIESLKKLGAKTLGAFADLPAAGVTRRLGERGVALHRLARGLDRATLIPAPEPRRYTVQVTAEYPITRTEALLFLLKYPLERLIGELDGEGLATRCLAWTLQIEGADPTSGRTWSASPSASLRLWTDLVRIELDRLHLEGGVLKVGLEAEEVEPRPAAQERLTGPRATPPGALSITLAHLAAEVGPDGFGTLLPHPAVCPEEREQEGPFGGSGGLFSPSAEPWVPDRAGPGTLSAAFRRRVPPEPIRVDLEEGRIRSFRWRGGRVWAQRVLGPWDISTRWWQEGAAITRRCFQVEGRGEIAHVWFEPRTEQWFLAGWMD